MQIVEKIKNLRKNSFFNHSKNYLVAELFNKAIAFMTIPVFTRMLLPEEYGILSIFGSIISIFSIIMGLNFHGAIGRRYYEEDSEFSNFVGSNLIFLIVLNIFLLILSYIFKEQLSSFFSIESNLFFIAIVISSFSFFIQLELAYLQASQQSKKYATISVFRNILIAGFGIICVYLLKENRYLGKVYSQLIVTGIICVFVMYNLKKLAKFNFNKEHIKYALFFGIPLIPHALSSFILNEFDRIIINQISGSYETGLYSFAYNIGMMMMVFVGAANNAWIPLFFENMKNSNYEKIQEMAEKYSKAMFFIALILILFSKEIIMIMADKNYYQALEIVPLIILGYIFVFLYTLFGNYSFYRKKTWLISIFTFIAGFLNIVLNYFFIPTYGYVAAAWVTLVSYFVLFLLHYINVKYILKETAIKLNQICLIYVFLLIEIVIYLEMKFENAIVDILFKFILIAIYIYILKVVGGKHSEREYDRKNQS